MNTETYDRKVDFPHSASPRSNIVTSGTSAIIDLHFRCVVRKRATSSERNLMTPDLVQVMC